MTKSQTQTQPAADKMSTKRAATRARLIEAASAAIGEKGFHAVTLDQIAARAGLTKGAVYDNFSSKEALFLEVVSSRSSDLPIPALARSEVLETRVLEFGRAVLAEARASQGQAPIRADFLLYSLSRPELLKGVGEWTRVGFARDTENLLALFATEELTMAPKDFILMLHAMIPGLMFIKTQAPDLVTNEAVLRIFKGLFRGL